MIEFGSVFRSPRTEPAQLKESVDRRDMPFPLGTGHRDNRGRVSLVFAAAEILGLTSPSAAAACAPSKVRLWLQARCVSDDQFGASLMTGRLREPSVRRLVDVGPKLIAVSHGDDRAFRRYRYA
ncbi:hypothetical protein [Aeromicrobium sp.]|uniref:hypothetical protein n=1 Tax=Aeromicrobium sp. TaxID=1871063 RepID=UPI002FC7017E